MALGNLTLGLAIFAFHHQKKGVPALSNLIIAKHCQGLAWGLFYFHGAIPELLTGPVANTILFIGLAFEAGAMSESVERCEWRRIVFPVLAVCIALSLTTYFFSENPLLRLASSSLAISALYFFGGACLALNWRSATLLRRSIALATLLLALFITARALWEMLLPISANGTSMLTPTVISLYLLLLINGFGFLLLSKEMQDAELDRISIVDQLTGAPNRRGFFNALLPWLSLARRPGHPTALLVLDLDHFKRINDDYGHTVGDFVLRSVVEIGQKQLRDSDLIGRLSSEEFAVLLPRTGLPEASIVAERMRQAIQDVPIKTERAIIHVTASFGLTIIRDDDSMVTLLKRADDALQEAKNQGRNRVIETQKSNDLSV